MMSNSVQFLTLTRRMVIGRWLRNLHQHRSSIMSMVTVNPSISNHDVQQRSISSTFGLNSKLIGSRMESILDEEIDQGNTQLQQLEIRVREPSRDRTRVIPVETSILYLKSQAYKETYGNLPVWIPYRRNFKGQFAPKLTRQTCIKEGQIISGNPCPLCRDEYLVMDYRNAELLKQFISPFNGQVLHWDKTNICQDKQFLLLVEFEKAKDYGTITFDLPFREYDYNDFKEFYSSST